ncbi:MAG TPA: amino acid permease [Actinomycetota bacterium]|nr:amino acid permease [Actinomycetota bacterium]
MAADADRLTSSSQEAPPVGKRFGTFEGVFTPTLLTILGVIMYLREGWVVGNAGFAGSVGIILIAFAITGATALSLSSLVTNIRIGAGGAYSIISQSLGLEVGGAVGIPLYASQALAVAMYVFGFRAGIQYVVADAPALLVDLVTFAFVLLVAYIGPTLAFRIQYLILAAIVASVVSIAVAAIGGSMTHPLTLLGDFRGAPESGFRGTSFWPVFAVFFPAATGIMAGTNLSGILRDPRRSIPRGTLAAIGVSLGVYLLLAYWLARSASPSELTSNYYVMVDRAAWAPAVVAGLLGATLSSALGSIVGAPRILQAIAANGVVPGSRLLAGQDRRGEPRNATLFTGGVVLAALLLRNLNAIAPLITMFFLITYATINIVVLIEQRLRLVSFRPLLRIPHFVPIAGAGGSVFAMFIINPVFGLVATSLVVAFYAVLVRRNLVATRGDLRSGLFVSIAEWAARRVIELGGTNERAWKPNLLVPVEEGASLRAMLPMIGSIAAPNGSVKLVGVGGHDEGELSRVVEHAIGELRRDGLFATSTVVDADSFQRGVATTIQAVAGGFLTPNVVLLAVPEEVERDQQLHAIMRAARDNGVGVALLARHPGTGLGRRREVALWIGDHGPSWRLEMDLPDLDLATLCALQVVKNWGARLTLVGLAAEAAHRSDAERYLDALAGAARLPSDTRRLVVPDASASPVDAADLAVFGLRADVELDEVRRTVHDLGASCLFAHDSGIESALA